MPLRTRGNEWDVSLSQSDTAKIWMGLGVCVLLTGSALGLAWLSSASPDAPPPAHHPQAAEDDGAQPQPGELLTHTVEDVYIGRDYDNTPRKRDTLLTTRQGGAAYQALIRYAARPVELKDVPGIAEIVQQALQQGKQLPNTVFRVDEETELFSKNLGQSVRLLTSYHAYVDPTDFRVMAYDLAQSTGGVPQRFVGYRTPKGVMVNIFRGNDRIDQREITFESNNTLMPLDYSFVHLAYSSDPDALARRAEKYRSIFLPGQLATLKLFAKPMGDEVIPIRNLTHLCSRYRVRVQSAESPDGPRAYQDMWFEKSTGALLRREDIEPSLKPGEAPVTESAPLSALEQTLAQLRERVQTPPRLPEKPFHYMLGTDLTYGIRARDSEVGRARLRFEPVPKTEGGVFAARATVSINSGGNSRHETALTLFDSQFIPVKYTADGDETGDARADYNLSALRKNNTVEVAMRRQLRPNSEPDTALESDANSAKPGVSATTNDPLRRVPIEEDDAASPELAALPPLTAYSHTRPLTDGTYLYDFHRVEHLAAFAHRLPLPPPPKDNEPVITTYQKVALYSVRQNRADVIQFEITPELKPRLTERQKRRQDPRDRDEPQLYIAASSHNLLNCRMLLCGDGRVLQLTINQGAGDVTYTLDDPIMRRREERAKQQRMQEGPQLLRPPWW
jgi:hypothetical protein